MCVPLFLFRFLNAEKHKVAIHSERMKCFQQPFQFPLMSHTISRDKIVVALLPHSVLSFCHSSHFWHVGFSETRTRRCRNCVFYFLHAELLPVCGLRLLGQGLAWVWSVWKFRVIAELHCCGKNSSSSNFFKKYKIPFDGNKKNSGLHKTETFLKLPSVSLFVSVFN